MLSPIALDDHEELDNESFLIVPSTQNPSSSSSSQMDPSHIITPTTTISSTNETLPTEKVFLETVDNEVEDPLYTSQVNQSSEGASIMNSDEASKTNQPFVDANWKPSTTMYNAPQSQSAQWTSPMNSLGYEVLFSEIIPAANGKGRVLRQLIRKNGEEKWILRQLSSDQDIDDDENEEQSAFDNIIPLDKLRNGWDVLSSIVSSTAEQTKQAVTATAEQTKQVVAPVWEKTKIHATEGYHKTSEKVHDATEKMKPTIENISHKVADGAASGWSAFTAFAQNATTSMKGVIDSLREDESSPRHQSPPQQRSNVFNI